MREAGDSISETRKRASEPVQKIPKLGAEVAGELNGVIFDCDA